MVGVGGSRYFQFYPLLEFISFFCSLRSRVIGTVTNMFAESWVAIFLNIVY